MPSSPAESSARSTSAVAISSASSLTTRSSLAGWLHDPAEAHAAFQNASLASFVAPPLAQAAP